MDPITLLILAVMGGAGYLYFFGSPASATAAQTTPTPTISASSVVSPTRAALLTSAASPGTTISTAPVASSAGVPPDSSFIAAGQAAYTAATNIKSGKYFSNFTAMLTAALGSMQLTPTGDNCSGYSTTNTSFEALGLSSTAATTGLAIAAQAGAVASSVAGPLTLGISAIVSLIAGIFSHHAAKVKAQAQYDCAGCAAVNNAWQQIQQAVSAGQITDSSTLQQAFESVYSQFQSLLQSSPAPPNTGPGDCNNPCNLIFICRQVTNKWEAQYAISS